MGTDQPRAPRRTAAVVVRAWTQDGGVAARLVLDPGDRPPAARSIVVGSLDELCAVLARELTVALHLESPPGATHPRP